MLTQADVTERLKNAGQSHLLAFAESLDEPSRQRLLSQISDIDLESVPTLVRDYIASKPGFALPPGLEPARYYPCDPASKERSWDRGHFRSVGEGLIRSGKVAAFVVAGGQGSRLGFEGPKGCFPAAAISGKSLFQIFAEQIRRARSVYGAAIPWYIMTSPLNHAPTVEFFEAHACFGLPKSDVMFFSQGVLPSFDLTSGKILLAEKDEVATNPDGHGGAVRAIARHALGDMDRRGIEHVSYFQVDNPHVRIVDPVFIGLHASAPDSSGEMSSKMIPKAGPEEKVGVFCMSNGKTEVIEYSDLPMELQGERLPDGSLRFVAGSVAIHLISTAFIRQLANDPRFTLPYHRAEKKVACIDSVTGDKIVPTTNNGVKLERFIFDALAMCRGSIVLETDRVEEFAPIKNASGSDSAATCHALQTERASRWLGVRGVKVVRKADGVVDGVIEISPLSAAEPADLAGITLPREIAAGQRVML